MPDEISTSSSQLTTPRGGADTVKSIFSSFFGNTAKKEAPQTTAKRTGGGYAVTRPAGGAGNLTARGGATSSSQHVQDDPVQLQSEYKQVINMMQDQI